MYKRQLFGGLAMPLYSLCVAHMNDHLAAGDFVEAGAALLTAYAIGAVAGPLAAGEMLPRFGPASLFLFTAAALLALALYGLFRMTRRPPVPAADQAAFVPAEQTTPQVFVLDPRSEEDLDHVAADGPDAPDPDAPDPAPSQPDGPPSDASAPAARS